MMKRELIRKKQYVCPSVYISDIEAALVLKGSIEVDNDEEHDGWADAKPRSEVEEGLAEDSGAYSDLW